MTEPQTLQTLLRLFAAAVATGLLGLERSRRTQQAIGVRTFGLIGVGAAVAGVIVTTAGLTEASALGRALQGVLMGVGFLGAGVIVHPGGGRRAFGVTTAASIWVAAVVGFAAGLGQWLLVGGAVGFALLLLVIPEPLELEGRRPGGPPLPPEAPEA